MQYRELLVWQRAMDLAERVFVLTKTSPPEQRHVLSAQMQRAAASIPANIAEGHGRKATLVFKNHLSIAAGSLYELETHLQLAHRLQLVADEDLKSILSQSDEVGRMLAGLKSKLAPRS